MLKHNIQLLRKPIPGSTGNYGKIQKCKICAIPYKSKQRRHYNLESKKIRGGTQITTLSTRETNDKWVKFNNDKAETFSNQLTGVFKPLPAAVDNQNLCSLVPEVVNLS